MYIIIFCICRINQFRGLILTSIPYFVYISCEVMGPIVRIVETTINKCNFALNEICIYIIIICSAIVFARRIDFRTS